MNIDIEFVASCVVITMIIVILINSNDNNGRLR